MERGFFSILIVVILAAAALALLSAAHANERTAEEAALDALRLEKDYSLRAGLRDGIRDSMLFGARQAFASGGEPEGGAVAELNEYANFAGKELAAEGLNASFWCAQAREDELSNAKKWAVNDVVSGLCWNASTPDILLPAKANACSLLVSFDSAGGGQVSIVRGGGVRVDARGEACEFPEISARGNEPSVFGATIRYADGNWSEVALPEGLVWE